MKKWIAQSDLTGRPLSSARRLWSKAVKGIGAASILVVSLLAVPGTASAACGFIEPQSAHGEPQSGHWDGVPEGSALQASGQGWKTLGGLPPAVAPNGIAIRGNYIGEGDPKDASFPVELEAKLLAFPRGKQILVSFHRPALSWCCQQLRRPALDLRLCLFVDQFFFGVAPSEEAELFRLAAGITLGDDSARASATSI